MSSKLVKQKLDPKSQTEAKQEEFKVIYYKQYVTEVQACMDDGEIQNTILKLIKSKTRCQS